MPKRQKASSPPPSLSPSLLHSLPDLALRRVAKYLNPIRIIKEVQLADHYCLTAFAEHIKGVTISSTVILKDPPPSCTTTRSYATWLNKHACVLCSFLSRFPRLTCLLAKDRAVVVAVLREVFQRMNFPNVEWCGRIVFHGMPFRILATALPKLRMLHLAHSPFLGPRQQDLDAFFEGFATGMFKNAQYIEIGASCRRVAISKLTAALQARENVGAFPRLTGIEIADCRNVSEIQQLLMLPSCGTLSKLQVHPASRNDVPALLTILASYMRRTHCTALESITTQASRDTTRILGDVSDALMTGMATKLNYIVGMSFRKDALQELTRIVQAGMLPKLKRLRLRRFVLDDESLPLLTACVIARPLVCLSLRHTRPPSDEAAVAFLQAVAGGSFRKLESLHIDVLPQRVLIRFVGMLSCARRRHLARLKLLVVTKNATPETLAMLRGFFHEVAVR